VSARESNPLVKLEVENKLPMRDHRGRRQRKKFKEQLEKRYAEQMWTAREVSEEDEGGITRHSWIYRVVCGLFCRK